MSTCLPSSSLDQISKLNVNDDKNNDSNVISSSDQLKPTVTQVWGPFYVQYAPFRAKISPVYAIGDPLVIKGRVFGVDNHRSLAFASIDIWHTSPQAEYDYHESDPNIKFEYKEELNTHGQSKHFDYRGRLITDEHGRYEFETVKPAAYFDTDNSRWRCPHIHYYVQAQGYKPLVTQIYFQGEDKNDIDRHIQESTTIQLKSIEYQRTDGSKFVYFTGEFDVFMETQSE